VPIGKIGAQHEVPGDLPLKAQAGVQRGQRGNVGRKHSGSLLADLDRLHGRIGIGSPGQGATFQVLLSCTSRGALEVQNSVTSSEAEQSNARAGITGTILVVEDEEVLRLGKLVHGIR
jgi:hypothetical protein